MRPDDVRLRVARRHPAHLHLSGRSSKFEFAAAAFDLAERFQTPVFVLTDLDIGMNDWMVPKADLGRQLRPDRGKVLTAEELDEVDPSRGIHRPDGDGIAPRTLPGVHPKGAHSRGAPGTTASAHTPRTPRNTSRSSIGSIGRSSARRVRGAAAPRAAGRRRTRRSGHVGGCHAACTEALDCSPPTALP